MGIDPRTAMSIGHLGCTAPPQLLRIAYRGRQVQPAACPLYDGAPPRLASNSAQRA